MAKVPPIKRTAPSTAISTRIRARGPPDYECVKLVLVALAKLAPHDLVAATLLGRNWVTQMRTQQRPCRC
jgi:hypothetical protein